MNFLHPQALWILLLGLPLLALHFYRGRVRKMSVPMLALWEQILLEENRKSAFRKIRHRISLLLNLLLLLVLTAAVAEPLIPGWNTPGQKWAFVIDTSPRMLIREEAGRSRLELAQAKAKEWLSGVGEVSLYDGMGIVEPSTGDHVRIQNALHRIEIRREGDALAVARSIQEGQPGVRVILFTDRGGRDEVCVGSPVENRGWVAGSWILAHGIHSPLVQVHARRFRGKRGEERIFVRWNGTLLREEQIDLGEEALFQMKLDPALHPDQSFDLGGVVEIGFSEKDAFPLDDVATFVIPATVPLPVIVFHPGRPDSRLMNALEGLVEARLVSEPVSIPIGNFEKVRSALQEGVAVVFDRCAPPGVLSRGAHLYFGATGGPKIEKPEIRDWDSDGPLFRGIDLTDLAVRRSRVLKEGSMLIESSRGPIAVQEQRGGFCRVAFGFPLSLSESDFTLRAAFPLFLRNWVEWVRVGGATRSFPRQADWLAPIFPSAPLWAGKGDFQISQRNGKRNVPGFRHPVEAWSPGPLRISSGEREEWIAVNMFHPELSDPGKETSSSPPIPRRPWYRDFPLPLAGACLALFLILMEWFLHHRGWI